MTTEMKMEPKIQELESVEYVEALNVGEVVRVQGREPMMIWSMYNDRENGLEIEFLGRGSCPNLIDLVEVLHSGLSLKDSHLVLRKPVVRKDQYWEHGAKTAGALGAYDVLDRRLNGAEL